MKKFALLAALICIALPSFAGEKVKDFTLKSNQGKNIRLAEQKGKVVMLNFWASWCGPCRQEMPHLEALYQRYKDSGFVLLGVNNDVSEAKAEEFLKDREISFPIVYDLDGKVRDQFKKYKGIPLSIFIGCNGEIETVHSSYVEGDEEEYKKHIKGLLRKCSI